MQMQISLQAEQSFNTQPVKNVWPLHCCLVQQCFKWLTPLLFPWLIYYQELSSNSYLGRELLLTSVSLTESIKECEWNVRAIIQKDSLFGAWSIFVEEQLKRSLSTSYLSIKILTIIAIILVSWSQSANALPDGSQWTALNDLFVVHLIAYSIKPSVQTMQLCKPGVDYMMMVVVVLECPLSKRFPGKDNSIFHLRQNPHLLLVVKHVPAFEVCWHILLVTS